VIRLVAFDLDGTLSPGLTVVGRLAQGIGKLPDMNALEARLARGEITRDVLAEAAAGHLRGMSVAGAAALLDPWALMPGAEETVVRLRTQGIAVLLVTLTWRFAAGLIGRRLALDGWSGSEPELDGDGLCTGKIRHLFTEPDKRHFIEAHAADLGIAMSQVVAVGDSAGDIPMFQAAGRSIALNASPAAREAATHALDAPDLRDILPLLGLP
jgi:phosphoserine phosphatase